MLERSPSELLASLILGSADAAGTAVAEIRERALWKNTVRLALTWRCIPQLRTRLSRFDITASPDAQDLMTSYTAAAAAESAMVCRGAAAAMVALESAGVKYAAFKGLAMIASVYRGPADRMVNDADILIDPTDFQAASGALRRAGFEPAISIGLESWLRLLEERVYPAHDYLDFVNSDGVRIDVHWRLAAARDFSIGGILERSGDSIISRQKIRIVSAEDAIVLTANHLVRDRLAPRSAVKDLADLDAWITIADGRWSVDVLSARVGNAGFTVSLLAGLRILARYDPEGPARMVSRSIGEASTTGENVAAQRLADLFALQLARGNVSELTVGIAGITPSLAGRFIISRLRSITSPEYRRNKFAGSDSAIVPEQARGFMRDILTLTPRRFLQYRALARETRRQIDSGYD